MELSECAFYGITEKHTLQTMKVMGVLNNHFVKILLDSGSTHNFIDSRLLKKVRWAFQSTKPFDVIIIDGGKVKSQRCCQQTLLELGGYHCSTYLYSLILGGCDVVLKVQWLSSVSHVLWDFQLLTMEFGVRQEKYKLSHNPSTQVATPLIQEITLQQLDKEFGNSNLGVLLYSIEPGIVESNNLTPQ